MEDRLSMEVEVVDRLNMVVVEVVDKLNMVEEVEVKVSMGITDYHLTIKLQKRLFLHILEDLHNQVEESISMVEMPRHWSWRRQLCSRLLHLVLQQQHFLMI